MAKLIPAPLRTIQGSRYAKQDSWELDDISLCSSGNIAVTDHNYMTYQSYVSIYSSTVDTFHYRDKPILLYHKQFADKNHWPSLRRRCISFMKPSSTKIVTCRYDKVQVIDYKQDVVLRFREVNGETMCLSVSDCQIVIGLVLSDIVNIYDNDLNEIKSIRLKGVGENWLRNIAAAVDRLYLCTAKYGRAIVYSQDSGCTLTEYTAGQYSSYACSIAVHIELGLTAVLWYQNDTGDKQMVFYLLSENTSILTINVESGVSRIRVSDQGRIVTGNEDTGDVKIYNLASLFSYSNLKRNLISRLGRDDCEKLAKFFAMGREEVNGILNSDRPAATLFLAFEEKGIIQPSNVAKLEEAFLRLGLSPSFNHAVDMYQKLRGQITSYDRFLATLSVHLTLSVPEKLCDYFHISDEQKTSIISSQNPGLSLLLFLDEMGIIKPSEVGCLEEPFKKFSLVQTLAKIDEYKEIVKEERRQLPSATPQSLEDKRALFVEFLKKKIKSWYETMSPVPWKKSCQWKSTDLFVGSGLILTDSKAKQNVQNIDEQCKLNYTEIFTHEKLKYEIRIILEGDPGAGKTMLSSQLAYDWSEGKIDGAEILIFLPLKIVENKTLIQAIKEFYIPPNTPLSEKDIEIILGSDTESICLLLDGLEEYSNQNRMKVKESSEMMKIMKKEKHSNCKVVITCRSDFAHDIPECPMLKLGRFGETERMTYIMKLSPHNSEKQQKMERIIQDNPFILDLCRVPLLFVLVVHNIESMSLLEEGELNKVSPFIRSMIVTLCSSRIVEHEVDGIHSESESRKMTLGELAFNGLCKGHQQLSWQKDFIESCVGRFKVWVDSGILVLEEGLVVPEKEDQHKPELNKEEKKGNTKEETKKKETRKRTQKEETKGNVETEVIPERSPSKKAMEEKKHEREADTSAVAPDEMLMEELLTSTSHDFPQPSVLPEEILTTSVGASQAGIEVTEIQKRHQSVSELENEPRVMKKKTVRRAAGQVPLTVKFLHKVIQEWFAATFFCSMMKRFTSKDGFQNYVSSTLHHISPTDLHYVLRFASFLYPPSCHLIISYLLRSYRKDGSVPPHIMNCVFVCFNEHNGMKGPDLKNVVKDVCKEVITIQSEDSRLLRHAKCALLEYASNNGVIIEKLELKDVIFAVDETSLKLKSGVQLGILDTIKLIEVSRWDQVLQEDDYKKILKLLSAGKLLQEVCCIFPSEPPDSLDKITLENIESKDLKVEWQIGNLVHCLDPRRGKWTTNFKHPGTSSPEVPQVIEDQDFHYLVEAKAIITKDGGVLEIPNTNVTLMIPPDCLPEDMEHCKMHLRIIPRERMKEGVTLFSSNSSMVVELLPNGLKFRQPVRLTIPHCWVLQGTNERKARIYISHHETGGVPKWEEQTHISYHLEDTACIILLNSLCFVKFSVDEEMVKAIKLIVYTAARKRRSVDEVAEIHIGYYWDLPDEKMAARRVRDLIVVRRKIFFFAERKEKELPLKISLDYIFPSNWQYHPETPQAVAYEQVVSLPRKVFIYTLVNKGNITGNPLCVFTVSQEGGQIAVQLAANLEITDKQLLPAEHLESVMNQSLDQREAPLKAEMTVTSAGGILTVNGSEVQLEIPPDAIPPHEKECFIRMTINPARVMEDQVTSFCSNSCTAVDISPCNFKLRYPAKLTLPHCLKVMKKEGLKARIFFNEEQGSPSPWREQENFEHELNDSACIMPLEKLCCVKYSIDESIVKGKRIMLYTAAQSVKQKDRLADADVGYYSDIPGGGELLQLNPNLQVDSETEVLFMEKQKFGLKLLLDCVIPSKWKYCTPNQNPQEIPYNVIASSIEHSHLYVLEKEKDYPGSVICKFIASQKNSLMSSELSLRICPQLDQLKGTTQAEQQVAKTDPMTVTITFLSKNLLWNEWKFVGKALDLEDAQLDHICHDYTGTRERIYEMLMLWKRKNGTAATHAKLIKSLEETGRKDLVESVLNRKDLEG